VVDECRINKNLADNKALKEYSDFNKTQKITSDFDKRIELCFKTKINLNFKV